VRARATTLEVPKPSAANPLPLLLEDDSLDAKGPVGDRGPAVSSRVVRPGAPSRVTPSLVKVEEDSEAEAEFEWFVLEVRLWQWSPPMTYAGRP
jgi:hypothetical protein